jgi:lysozyme family protein
MANLIFRIDSKVHDGLKSLAAIRGQSLQSLVVEVLEAYLLQHLDEFSKFAKKQKRKEVTEHAGDRA